MPLRRALEPPELRKSRALVYEPQTSEGQRGPFDPEEEIKGEAGCGLEENSTNRRNIEAGSEDSSLEVRPSNTGRCVV